MPHRKWIGLFLLFIALLSAHPSIAQVKTGQLTVAWVENGSLMVWKEAEATGQELVSGDVNYPYIAPDGEHIAFARGFLPNELWVIEENGAGEQKVVDASQFTPGDGTPFLAQISWSNNSTIFFNTLRQNAFGLQPQNDLWRVDIQTGETTIILDANEGGSFSISPDRKTVAVIYPGRYAEPNGRIRLVNVDTLVWQDIFTFTGISSGSEAAFYPEMFWEADSSTVRVAIPDKDLVYDDINAPPTDLWRITVDGQSEKIGSVQASFFGQPHWSSDGNNLTYLERTGEATSNQFALMVSDGDGRNAAEYARGEAGKIGSPVWIHGTDQFVYAYDAPGTYWIGRVGSSPFRLSENFLSLRFVDATSYLFITTQANSFELHYARLDEDHSTLIAAGQNVLLFYDAQITHD
jgi:dipeptidyl aminopeptidase/acylaminoacyl peptidase